MKKKDITFEEIEAEFNAMKEQLILKGVRYKRDEEPRG